MFKNLLTLFLLAFTAPTYAYKTSALDALSHDGLNEQAIIKVLDLDGDCISGRTNEDENGCRWRKVTLEALLSKTLTGGQFVAGTLTLNFRDGSNLQITGFGEGGGSGSGPSLDRAGVLSLLGALSASEKEALQINDLTRQQENEIGKIDLLSSIVTGIASDSRSVSWQSSTDVEIALSTTPVINLAGFQGLTWETTHDRSAFSNPINRYVYLRLSDNEKVQNYRVLVTNDDGVTETINGFVQRAAETDDSFRYFAYGSSNRQVQYLFAGLSVITAQAYLQTDRVSLFRLPIIQALIIEPLSAITKAALNIFDPASWARDGSTDQIPSNKLGRAVRNVDDRANETPVLDEVIFDRSDEKFYKGVEGSGSGPIGGIEFLYMVDGVTDVLYILDTTSGTATRVGSATNFGVGEDSVSGLAYHNGTLYMVGVTNQALYTVNTSSGVATRVGSATAFGVNETTPAGLASHNGSLYMVGDNDVLYTVSTTTGVATRVGSATDFGVNETFPSGLASFDGVLYMAGEDNGALFTLDTTTGEATRVGSATDFGVGEDSPTGIVFHNGTLYMVGFTNKALYTVSTTTGQATRVGSATQFGVGAVDPSGLASTSSIIPTGGGGLSWEEVREQVQSDWNETDTESVSFIRNKPVITEDLRNVASRGSETPVVDEVIFDRAEGKFYEGVSATIEGALYMVGEGMNALYTVDTTTGAATRVGNADMFGITGAVPQGLAFHNGALYMVASISDTNSALFTVNLTTGAATQVGSATFFGVNEAIPTGLASLNGSLYMVGNTAVLYTVSTTTGAATQVGSATAFGVGESVPTGLTAHNNVLYLVGAGVSQLLTVDTTTGVATQVGSTSFGFGIGEIATGVASFNGNLYLLCGLTKKLCSLNTTTGVASRIGNVENFGIGEGSPSGLAGSGPSTVVQWDEIPTGGGGGSSPDLTAQVDALQDAQTATQAESDSNRTSIQNLFSLFGGLYTDINPIFDFITGFASSEQILDGLTLQGLFHSFQDGSHASLANRETGGANISLTTTHAYDIVGNTALFSSSARGSSVRRAILNINNLTNKTNLLTTFRLALATSSSLTDVDLVRAIQDDDQENVLLRLQGGNLIIPLDNSEGQTTHQVRVTQPLSATESSTNLSPSSTETLNYTLPVGFNTGDNIIINFSLLDANGVLRGRSRPQRIDNFNVTQDRDDVSLSHFYGLTSEGGNTNAVLSWSYVASTRVLTIESAATLSNSDATTDVISVNARSEEIESQTTTTSNSFVTLVEGVRRSTTYPIALKLGTSSGKTTITVAVHGQLHEAEVSNAYDNPTRLRYGTSSHEFFQSIALLNFNSDFNDQDLLGINIGYPDRDQSPRSLFFHQVDAHSEFDIERKSRGDTSLKSARFSSDFSQFITDTQDDVEVIQDLPFLRADAGSTQTRSLVGQLPRAFPHNLPSNSNHVGAGGANFIVLDSSAQFGVAYIGRQNSTNLIPVYFNTADVTENGVTRQFSPDNSDDHVIVLTRILTGNTDEYTIYLSTEASSLGYDRLFYADSFSIFQSDFFQGAKGEKGEKGDDGIDGSQESGLTIRQKIDSDLVQEHRLRGDKIQGLTNLGWAKINTGVVRQGVTDSSDTTIGWSYANGVFNDAILGERYLKAGQISQVSVANILISISNRLSTQIDIRVNQDSKSLAGGKFFLRRSGAVTEYPIIAGLVGVTDHTRSWGSQQDYDAYDIGQGTNVQLEDGDEVIIQYADGSYLLGGLIQTDNVEDGAITVDKLAQDARAPPARSASDIKSLYESNSDTNAFTDALLTKLNDLTQGALSFLDLTDTPSGFGTAGQILQVNSAGTGLVFADAPSGGGGTLDGEYVEVVDDISTRTVVEGEVLYDRQTQGFYEGANVTIGDTLYMVGSTNDALYTVNPTTGEATRIGSATAFGVGETTPSALAFHNGTLYMGGGGGLYTLNTTTGVATLVGGFQHRGLASHNGTLYSVSGGGLYTLNTTTGVATLVGGLGVADGLGLASHNGSLYMVDHDNDVLYTVNTTTGQATRVGNSFRFGVAEQSPQGLSSLNGTLYMVGATNGALYTVNTTTGSATRVGSAINFGVSEAVPIGLAGGGGVQGLRWVSVGGSGGGGTIAPSTTPSTTPTISLNVTDHYLRLGSANLASTSSGLTSGADTSFIAGSQVDLFILRFANNLADSNTPTGASYNTQNGQIFLPAGLWKIDASVNLVTQGGGSGDRVYSALSIYYGSTEEYSNSLYLRNNAAILPGSTRGDISGKITVNGTVISDGVTPIEIRILHSSQTLNTVNIRGAHIHATQQLALPTIQ